MEALLEKEGMVENWNDERLDELSRRVDAGFEKTATKEETNRRFDESDRRLDEITSAVRYLGERFDRLQNTLMIGLTGLIAVIAGNAIFG